MSILAISQRVENLSSYRERRDCLDQRWVRVANALSLLPVALPNLGDAKQLLLDLKPRAIILSGGNSIARLNPSALDAAPERDKFEFALIKHAIEQQIPVIGVCRGMQLINLYFGGSVAPIANHVDTIHKIKFTNTQLNMRTVNSYHNWGIMQPDLADNMRVLASCSHDASIEAIQHTSLAIAGIMWHPEREERLDSADIDLLTNCLL